MSPPALPPMGPPSRALLECPPGKHGFGAARTKEDDVTTRLMTIVDNLAQKGHLDAHPDGGLRISPAGLPFLTGGGALHYRLPDGHLWIWQKNGHRPSAHGAALLGWDTPKGVQIYPSILTRDRDHLKRPLAEVLAMDTQPWRATLATPEARVCLDRDGAAQGHGFLPWWLVPSAGICTVPARLAPLWDLFENLTLGALLGVPDARDLFIHIHCQASELDGDGFAWQGNILSTRILTPSASGVAGDLEGAVLDAGDAVERTMAHIFGHPDCPFRPIHMAGHNRFNPKRGLPPLFSGHLHTVSAHRQILARQLWTTAQRDPAAFAALALAQTAPTAAA